MVCLHSPYWSLVIQRNLRKLLGKGMRSTKQLLGSSMREFQTFIILIFLLLRGLQAFIFVCFGMLCHVLQTECRFNNAVKFMEGWSASWDCCFSLRCKFIFRQIRITSSDHLKKHIKNTQTFATFQLGIHITGGMTLSVTWQEVLS